MNKFSTQKYDRRKAVFAAVRAGASALRDAVHTSDELKEWDPNNLPADINSEAKLQPFKGLAECESYMERYSAASLDALSNEKVAIGYSIFGDVKRDVVLGANTVGVEVEFDWAVGEVSVSTYNGVNREAQPVIHAKEVLATGGKERSGIQKATGWDRRDCDTMSPEQVQLLITLLETGKAGYNKYTRLVKGMLIYLDLLHHGAQRVNKTTDTIPYKMADVLGAYTQRDRAYVFCSDGSSWEYIAVLMAIGERYPNPDINSFCDAVVPQDAERVTVVVNGNVPAAKNLGVTLTPQLVMASLMKYAEESWCSDELESAMVCACSLYENRYLMRAMLPRVVSSVDLILPAMMKPVEVKSARPHVTRGMVSTVGKLHQMCMLLTIKDVLMAAKASTKRGFSYGAVVRQYLASQEEVISKMSGKATPLTMLEITPQLRWMYVIDDNALAFLDSVSIFEALWLCDGGLRSIRDGGITVLKKGVLDMMGNNPYREIVDQELRKTNIVFDFDTLPKGNFTISSRYIRDTAEQKVPKCEYITIPVKIAYDCDYTPRDDISTKNYVRHMRLRSQGGPRRSMEVIEGEKLELRKVRTSSHGTSSGEYSSILSDWQGRKLSRQEIITRVKSVSPPKGVKVVDTESSVKVVRSKSSDDSRRVSIDKGAKSRVKASIMEVLKDKGKVDETRKERIEAKDVEVEILRNDNSLGKGEDVEEDTAALVNAGVSASVTIAGRSAFEFVKWVRDHYDSGELKPNEMARLCYILMDVETEVVMEAMSLEDIKHVVNVRDSYKRRYRGAESGRARHFSEEEGKLLSLELNIRRGRQARGESDINKVTGIITEARINSLMREFYLNQHEISVLSH